MKIEVKVCDICGKPFLDRDKQKFIGKIIFQKNEGVGNYWTTDLTLGSVCVVCYNGLFEKFSKTKEELLTKIDIGKAIEFFKAKKKLKLSDLSEFDEHIKEITEKEATK